MQIADMTLQEMVEFLKSRGLSQRQIARKTGTTPQAISRVATGRGEDAMYSNTAKPLIKLAQQAYLYDLHFDRNGSPREAA